MRLRLILVLLGASVVAAAGLILGPLRPSVFDPAVGELAKLAAVTETSSKRDASDHPVRAAPSAPQDRQANAEKGSEIEAAPQKSGQADEHGGHEAIPAFDVVRVEPNGDAVIAGRGAPGAVVELLRDGIVHERAVTDASGLFAMTPPQLGEGDHQLTLHMITPDGHQALSKDSVAVSIALQRKQAPVVALAAPDRPTVVLSDPNRPSGNQAGNTRSLSSGVTIDTTEAGEAGKLYVSGRGAPGATVRLYLNDSYLASGSADQEGRLSFTIASGIVPGDYRIRLDHVDAVTGAVKSRAEVPFSLPRSQLAAAPAEKASEQGALDKTTAAQKQRSDKTSAVIVPEIKTASVVRGDSLWRISRNIYGEGLRYTVIYSANQGQIRNPDLIYPGQTFVLPRDKP